MECPFECKTCPSYVVFGVNTGCRKGLIPQRTLERRVEELEQFLKPMDWPGYVVLNRKVEEYQDLVNHLRNEVAFLTAKKKSKYA